MSAASFIHLAQHRRILGLPLLSPSHLALPEPLPHTASASASTSIFPPASPTPNQYSTPINPGSPPPSPNVHSPATYSDALSRSARNPSTVSTSTTSVHVFSIRTSPVHQRCCA